MVKKQVIQSTILTVLLLVSSMAFAVEFGSNSANITNRYFTGADVAKGFMFSTEFIGKGTDNSEYLTILYQAFFNRDPDPAGWDEWISELNAGKDRGGVLDGFIYSTEFSNLCSEYGIKAF